MVVATAVPASAPNKLKQAARITACLAVSTLVATLVAIALAASWKPLRYSKAQRDDDQQDDESHTAV